MFDVGDLVVCVDAHSPPRSTGCLTQAEVEATARFLRQGQYYRVSAMPMGDRCRLQGDPWPPHAIGGFRCSRFRKIDAPDTEVSRLIRACKPVREGQPA